MTLTMTNVTPYTTEKQRYTRVLFVHTLSRLFLLRRLYLVWV